MESNKIDTLFKNKLERHEKTVSSDAWSRVNSKLSAEKKHYARKWYVAASISLLFICAFSLLYNKSLDSNNTTAINPIELGQSYFAFEAPLQRVNQNKPLAQIKEPSARQIIKNSSTPVYQKVNKQVTDKVAANNFEKREDLSLPKIANQPSFLIVVAANDYRNQVIAKVNTKIIVEINFNPEKETEFEQSRNKLKSLASELSIADLRASKNELFASALNFDKKRLN
ncbi:MAG: hypothetical protein ACJAT1_001932 [Marivirga sp.]|jgi:hypothetical protein